MGGKVGIGGHKCECAVCCSVDAGEYVYESQETRRPRDTMTPLTVIGPVPFAIEKDHAYIVSRGETET